MYISNWMAIANSNITNKITLVNQSIACMENEYEHDKNSYQMKLKVLNRTNQFDLAVQCLWKEYNSIQPTLFNHNITQLDDHDSDSPLLPMDMNRIHQCILHMDEEFMITISNSLKHVMESYEERRGPSPEVELRIETIHQIFIHILTGFLEWQTKYAYKTKSIINEELYQEVLSMMSMFIAHSNALQIPSLNNSLAMNSNSNNNNNLDLVPSDASITGGGSKTSGTVSAAEDIDKQQATIDVLLSLIIHKVLENTYKRLQYVFPHPSYEVIIAYLRVCWLYSANSKEPSKIQIFNNSLNLIQKLNPTMYRSSKVIYEDMDACLQLLAIYKVTRQYRLAIAFVTEYMFHHSANDSTVHTLQWKLYDILVHCDQWKHAEKYKQIINERNILSSNV